MNSLVFDPITIIFFLIFAVVVSFPLLVDDKTMERMFSLRKLDRSWDKLFPDVENRDIYAFMDMLVESLGHEGKNRLVLKPTDKVRDVYKALHPPDGAVDASELQTFIHIMKEKFGVDLSEVDEPWEMELGDLLARSKGLDKAGAVSKPPSGE